MNKMLDKYEPQIQSKSAVTARVSFMFALVPLLTSCATSIPGLDRILFKNSSATVGPIVTAEQEYPAQDEATANALPPATTVEPTAKPVEDAVAKPAPKTEPVVVDEAKTQVTKPVASDLPKAPKQPAPIAVKPKKETVAKEVSTNVVEQPVAEPIAIEYGSVDGVVALVGEDNKSLPTTGTLITLTSQSMVNEVADRRSQVHIIDMEDKKYKPRYTNIHAGDQVVFVNKDKIRHNVFSSSGNNAFDLGTYGAGLKRAVTLKEPGVVKIYCNIHSEMATFIAVGNQGLSARVDDKGRYQINNVLPGTYEVSIWNIRGEKKRMIEVKANEATKLVDRIDTTTFNLEPHKNKFGGSYPKNSTLFEDEFY